MEFTVKQLTFRIDSEENRTVLVRSSFPGIQGELTTYYNHKPKTASKESILEVPETVVYDNVEYTVIGIMEDVFCNLNMLRELHLPSTLETFDWCLWGCNNLQNIIVDDNNRTLMSIDGVLYEKKNGKPYKLLAFPLARDGKYILPESVKHIESKAFKCCKITELVLNENIETIGDNVFYRCSRLKEIVLPYRLRKIGKCQDDTSVEYVFRNRRYASNDIYSAVNITKEERNEQ